jgi:hypothetical protein
MKILLNAYQWIFGIVFLAARLTVWNGRVSKARRMVNCMPGIRVAGAGG